MNPISFKFPSIEDLAQTDLIYEAISLCDTSPSSTEIQLKIDSLERIARLWTLWTKAVLANNNVDSGVLLLSGSYRLGVDTAGGDIDTLCVAPYGITQDDFFNTFYKVILLDKNITDIISVPKAFVPRISFRINGQEFDLLFAQLPTTKLTDLNVCDDKYLLTDAKSISSLNGPRVTELILQAVPNLSTFRTVLRYIRCWAKRRCIYSNIVGYLGGVSWSIMVAFICKLYPNSSPNTIIRTFFKLFSIWKWPNPICIHDLTTRRPSGALGFIKTWTASPEKEIMPVITPAYPHGNSTFNVSKSTFRVIKNELERANQLVNMNLWSDVLIPVSFFNSYTILLQIVISADLEDRLRVWTGFIESRLRKFIISLETKKEIEVVPYPKMFRNPEKIESICFIGMNVNVSEQKVDLGKNVQQFRDLIMSTVDIEKTDDMNFVIQVVKIANLPLWIFSNQVNPYV